MTSSKSKVEDPVESSDPGTRFDGAAQESVAITDKRRTREARDHRGVSIAHRHIDRVTDKQTDRQIKDLCMSYSIIVNRWLKSITVGIKTHIARSWVRLPVESLLNGY